MILNLQLPRIQPFIAKCFHVFDLDHKLIFIPVYIWSNGLRKTKQLVQSQAGSWYRPGYQLILLNPRLVFFILNPNCLLNKA